MSLAFSFNLKTAISHLLHVKRHRHVIMSFHLLVHFFHYFSIDLISMFFGFKDYKGKPNGITTCCSSMGLRLFRMVALQADLQEYTTGSQDEFLPLLTRIGRVTMRLCTPSPLLSLAVGLCIMMHTLPRHENSALEALCPMQKSTYFRKRAMLIGLRMRYYRFCGMKTKYTRFFAWT